MSLSAPVLRCLWRTGGVAFILGLVLAVSLQLCPLRGATGEFSTVPRNGIALNPDDEALIDDMQRAAFRYFIEQSDPRTGLVRDRARADGSPSSGKASIAASGFGISAWTIAVQRGWIDRQTALNHIRLALHFLAEKAPRQHGFFYHFMEMDSGARAWKCELSPIDTGLFLSGAVFAREYFGDPEITRLVDQLYADVDWNWFLNGGETLALSWHPETGFSRFHWEKYSEQMMLSLLGMGSPQKPLPAGYWQAWSREPVGTYAGLHYIQAAPLFVHQFTHAYVDFRGLRDAYADYFRNSVLATMAQRQFCIDLRDEFPTWDGRLWGVTASDSATGYKAWGGPPRTTDANNLDGTIVPCAAAGSLPFTPDEAITTLRYMRTAYGDRIWQRYGFVDSFNPETGWTNPDVLGIDLGISLLQAENARSGFVWSVFMRAPEVRMALDRAGFFSMNRALPRSDRDRLRDLAVTDWALVSADPIRAETEGLQLSSIVAARAVGLIDGETAATRSLALLKAGPTPKSELGLAEFAASLVTLRQAIPRLEGEATKRLNAIDWRIVVPASPQLGALDRLTVFFQVATGARPVQAWTQLQRTPIKDGPVYVLAPAKVADQVVPGLWLDEHAVISGASAAQLAYAQLLSDRRTQARDDVITTALLLEHFPAEVAANLKRAAVPPQWLAQASPADRATLLISLANVLAADCMREWFQQDALTRTGRAAIPEFAAAAFGPQDSVFWRFELAGPPQTPPERRAVAVAAGTPRDKWPWVSMSGLEYKDSAADVRPGDPPLSLRFAFTWDKDALHFHAEATDTPPGFNSPAGPRGVELFVNPRNDGLVWSGPNDFHFNFKPDGPMEEWFHHQPATARVRLTKTGYVVEADVKWSTLGLTPHQGLEFGIAPAVIASGTKEWDPSLKLAWRLYQRADDRFGLGVIRLE
ncbi:MAG TPA: glucoamylase family protein [Candidatus Didemnitutus sp.]|nr:glucoamylase family protein [Candidatus Didemnitutus sp.]